MSYKRIIVAVDGSETADLALMHALDLAKSLQAKICIIYVIDACPNANLALGMDFDRWREIIKEDGLSILDRAKQIAEKNNVLIETQLVEIMDASKISQKIIETALSWKADLLIMGTHGRRGFNRLILGSVAEETIRIAPIPILLIRAKEGT